MNNSLSKVTEFGKLNPVKFGAASCAAGVIITLLVIFAIRAIKKYREKKNDAAKPAEENKQAA